MKNLLFNNTYQSGNIHSFVFKEGEKDKYFTGVALEFDLVVQATTPTKAEECLMDAVENYLKNVVENDLSEELLNQPADKKYWQIYKKALKTEEKFAQIILEDGKKSAISLPSPFNIIRAGYKDGNFNFA